MARLWEAGSWDPLCLERGVSLSLNPSRSRLVLPSLLPSIPSPFLQFFSHLLEAHICIDGCFSFVLTSVLNTYLSFSFSSVELHVSFYQLWAVAFRFSIKAYLTLSRHPAFSRWNIFINMPLHTCAGASRLLYSSEPSRHHGSVNWKLLPSQCLAL